jgi:hypothetical protein
MKRSVRWFLLAGAVSGLAAAGACGGAKSGKGFHLPEGDVERGKAAFAALGCNGCHSVSGVELPAPAVPGAVQIKLGGEVLRVKTYGELVTSIIDPSHVVSPAFRARFEEEGMPPMPDLTGSMSVAQMIDLVAFLHASYKKVHPEYIDVPYPNYGFGPPPTKIPGATPVR